MYSSLKCSSTFPCSSFDSVNPAVPSKDAEVELSEEFRNSLSSHSRSLNHSWYDLGAFELLQRARSDISGLGISLICANDI